MAPYVQKQVLDVAIVYNRSVGLEKDAKLLEDALSVAAKAQGQSVGKIKHLDPREVPVMCDIVIHLEVPYSVWFQYARYNILVVNPEWWVSEAYDAYLYEVDLVLFKNEHVRDTFKIVCGLSDEKVALVPWCTDAKAPVVNGVKEFLYMIGGSPNKAAGAKDLVSLWKPTYPALNIYTSRTDFSFGEEAKENVRVICKDLEAIEVVGLQRKYLGHCALSEAEGFGFAAAEAESVGAFCILNHNDAYDAAYSEDKYVRLLPTNQVANDKTRSSRYVLDISGSCGAVLDSAVADFLECDFGFCMAARRAASDARRVAFKAAVVPVFQKASQGVEASRSTQKTRHVPPVLMQDDCPPISIITLVYNRVKFWDLALHNMMITDYPREKLEWVIVDDSDDMEQSISHKISKIQSVLPGLNVVYVPYHTKLTIGGKRNMGVKRATHDILLMMDDDDHYPESSFRRRVAWLTKTPNKGCAVCTTIALYDLKTGVSAVNVPPYDISLGKRISEATLTFYRNFYKDRKFEITNMAEGDAFIQGREREVVEMPPQQIIVSFCHGNNSSSRRIPPSDVKPACFWGFPPEFLIFVHKLAGVDVELQGVAPVAPVASSAARRTR